jgi:hypothetical protein
MRAVLKAFLLFVALGAVFGAIDSGTSSAAV